MYIWIEYNPQYAISSCLLLLFFQWYTSTHLLFFSVCIEHILVFTASVYHFISVFGHVMEALAYDIKCYIYNAFFDGLSFVPIY